VQRESGVDFITMPQFDVHRLNRNVSAPQISFEFLQHTPQGKQQPFEALNRVRKVIPPLIPLTGSMWHSSIWSFTQKPCNVVRDSAAKSSRQRCSGNRQYIADSDNAGCLQLFENPAFDRESQHRKL
jgi:hypothetical protein